MPKYCCFWCPKYDYSEHTLDESCPECHREFGRPLIAIPQAIRSYVTLRPLRRGFYGAIYQALQPRLGRSVVLKVVPVAIYEFFKKDWEEESAEHARAAAESPFVVGILDSFTDTIKFGDDPIDCNVAVLQHVPGPTLEELLDSGGNDLTPRKAAQIASDLFEILGLFEGLQRHHNDLHAGNIIVQQLARAAYRSEGFDPGVRAVVVDFGSLAVESLSADPRLGDQHWLAQHMLRLAEAVRGEVDQEHEMDYRIAEVLRGFGEHLAPQAGTQRVMSAGDAIQLLQGAVRRVDEPWKQPLQLRSFGDGYNAQTLESWHVPSLWLDPNDTWFNRASGQGPLVITGMRGCGKTILLKALHFHARAVRAREAGNGDVLDRLHKDGFIGLFASSQRLLNPQGRSLVDVLHPFERLYLAYCKDAVHVLRHLRSLDRAALDAAIQDVLAPTLSVLEVPAGYGSFATEYEFERFLGELLIKLSSGAGAARLAVSPVEAFAHLGAVLRRSSRAFADMYVLFLLDDVSTRYLPPEMLKKIMSQLLFQHSECAFKITTEAQAVARLLLSPGGIAPADPARDFREFDLGSEVYRHLQSASPTEKVQFVAEILRRRGLRFSDQIYRVAPVTVLGNDTTLEQIAEQIARSSESGPERKSVYRGIRALQAVCVGDIGDVVRIYERILTRARLDQLPVKAQDQAECFLEHSATLVHYLNRKDQAKKHLALAFAQAAGELLQRSARERREGKKPRLRQYTKLYVRVEPGPDAAHTAEQLLELLDAGVFVYDGGSPRTKTRDEDPVLQFKLSYRKLLGLASFIGLADRDRFELSGRSLRDWLNKPAEAKQILLDNQVRDDTANGELKAENGVAPEASLATELAGEASQISFLEQAARVDEPELAATSPQPRLEVARHDLDMIARGGIDILIVAQGFEERTTESVRRIVAATRPKQAIVLQYGNRAQGEGIPQLLVKARVRTQYVDASRPDAIENLGSLLGRSSGEITLDTTGMSKPFIYAGVRDALRLRGRVQVVHTLAILYYPTNDDLVASGITADSRLTTSELLARAANILVGESAPYSMQAVQAYPAEADRPRVLIASASPKNDRLLHLLSERDYDAAIVFVPPPTSPRRKVARASAELARSIADVNTTFVDVDTNDVEAALIASIKAYQQAFFVSGAVVEFGLTGSKMHAVAFAALAATQRVSHAWYVKPSEFDAARFTRGVAVTECFTVAIGR